MKSLMHIGCEHNLLTHNCNKTHVLLLPVSTSLCLLLKQANILLSMHFKWGLQPLLTAFLCFCRCSRFKEFTFYVHFCVSSESVSILINAKSKERMHAFASVNTYRLFSLLFCSLFRLQFYSDLTPSITGSLCKVELCCSEVGKTLLIIPSSARPYPLDWMQWPTKHIAFEHSCQA